jgi:hypothetical protein
MLARMERRFEPVIETAALCVLLALVALYAASPIFAVDFFWHLKLGELIRDTGSIPRTDLFSAVHPDRPYVQFNWLWELIAAWIVSGFGLGGMRVAQAVLIAASYAVLYRAARRAFEMRTLAFAFSALAVILFEDRFQVRPGALVLGFVALMLPLLLDPLVRARRSTPWLVLLMAVAWSNLHGGESVLLVLSLGAVLAGELAHLVVLQRQDAQPKRASVLLALAVLGLVLSPTLVDGIRHWITAVGPQIQSGNEEWLPSYTMLKNGWRPAYILIGLGPSMIALVYAVEQTLRVRTLGRAAIDVREWLLCAGYLALAHQAVRNCFLCLLPLAFMLQRYAQGLRSSEHARRRRNARWVAAMLAAVLLGISFEDAVLYGYGSFERARALFASNLAPATYPEHTTRFMREAGIEGGILNDGRWGGYLSWLLWPRCGTFVDSRHDLTPEMWPIFLESHAPLQRAPMLELGFARYGTELTAFRAPTFPTHVPSPGWQLIFKAGEEEIFQHERGAHAAQNFERVRRWLSAHGEQVAADAPPSALGAASTRIGARAWLAAPMQQLRIRGAEQAIAREDAATRARGLREKGALQWQAGLYADATHTLEAALAIEPENAGARYHTALAYFAQGDAPRSRAQLPVLLRLQQQLSPLRRGRMALLANALAQHDAQ